MKILGDHIENTAISILAQRQETDEEGLEQSKNPPLSIYVYKIAERLLSPHEVINNF